MTSFEELGVWKLGMQLAREVYTMIKHLPKEELFGLTSQLRRAAVSIPTNTAEGYGRHSQKENLQFLGIASGSQAEVTTLLHLTRDVYEIPQCKDLLELNFRIGQMLFRLRQSIRNQIK